MVATKRNVFRISSVLLKILIFLLVVCDVSGRKKKHVETPSDDATHVVQPHADVSSSSGSSKGNKRSRRNLDPGALGEVNVREQDPPSASRKGRLRFRDPTVPPPAVEEPLELVSTERVFGASLTSERPSRSELLEEIERAKLSFQPASSAQEQMIEPAISILPIPPPRVQTSTTSYVNDNHLPDAVPEKPSQDEEDPFAAFEENVVVQPPKPIIVQQQGQKDRVKVEEDPFDGVADTVDASAPKVGFFASTISDLGSKMATVFPLKQEAQSSTDAYGHKLIVPGSGGLPLSLTGFSQNSGRPSTPLLQVQVAAKPVASVPESDPFGDLSDPAKDRMKPVANVQSLDPIQQAIQAAMGGQMVVPPAPTAGSELIVKKPAGVTQGGRLSDASVTPIEHSYHRFLDKKVKEALIRNNGQIDVVLLGDSILSHIQREQKIWSEFSMRYRVMNLGSPGDRTEHLLFRLSNQEVMSSLSNAKLVVLMIGTNNIGIGDSVDSVYNGVATVVEKIKQIFPSKIHIVLLSILPRASVGLSSAIEAVNMRLATKYLENSNVHFMNVYDKFVDSSRKPNEKMFMPDRIHPSARGYQVLLDVMKSYLDAAQ